jgi:hypothetical protein
VRARAGQAGRIRRAPSGLEVWTVGAVVGKGKSSIPAVLGNAGKEDVVER